MSLINKEVWFFLNFTFASGMTQHSEVSIQLLFNPYMWFRGRFSNFIVFFMDKLYYKWTYSLSKKKKKNKIVMFNKVRDVKEE